MKKNDYQKCPNCSIWVEKKEGCQYIDCKCGTAFCYKCGAEFASDPCRTGEILNENNQIRKILFDFKYSPPESAIGRTFFNLGYILWPLKLALQLILIILLTAAGSALLTISIVMRYACALMFTPCIALHIVCAQVPPELRLCALIFYPLVLVFLILLFLVLMVMYPFFRNFYHHGIYDQLERSILGMSKCYLGCVKGIISM